ncbi:MAG: magnesium and cobalt transport protein CorA [Lautropia sp.]
MLINCAAYRDGRKVADLPIDAISDYLSEPDTFVWVALHDATPEELAVMQAEFGLHDLAVEDARHGHQRPKFEEYGHSLFTVMHLIERGSDGQLDVGEVDVFTGRNFVLSVRNRSTRGFLGVRERCEREPELLRNGSGFVLYALMDAVVDRYFPIIDGLEDELERIEAGMFTEGNVRANIQRLYELKRRVMVLKHAVAPLLEGTTKVYGGRVPVFCAGVQEYFRDVIDHLIRINGLVDTMRDTITTAIQVNLSMVTIEDSEITKKLASYASVFAVCTAFAGIWGMNFEYMPELKLRYGYPLALLTIAVSCGVLLWRFRKLRWI